MIIFFMLTRFHLISQGWRPRDHEAPSDFPGNSQPKEMSVQSDITTIYVPDNYTTIQEAVDSSNTGDTIIVRAATYFEHVVVKKDSIQIVGQDKSNTTVDGDGSGTALHIEANNVTVSGFTFKNGITGIFLNNATGCTVLDTNVTSCKFGIRLAFASNCTIRENNLTDNEYGIRLDSSPYNSITENTMHDNQYNFGVLGSSLEHFIQTVDNSNTVNGKMIYYIVNAENLLIDPTNHANAGYLAIVNSSTIAVRDIAASNNVQGILLAYTSHTTIENVTMADNKIGIGLYHCSNCTAQESTAFYNMYQGILLLGSSQCTVRDNNLTMNTEGISLTSSSSCTTEGNTLVNNDIGIKLDNTSNNTFFHNNMINNAEQASAHNSMAEAFDDALEGNYWSDQATQDLNQDGISELPYTINTAIADNHPLMGAYHSFKIEDQTSIDVISNFTVGNPHIDKEAKRITFNLTLASGNKGFCRICIPTAFIENPYLLLTCNKTELLINTTIYENETHKWFYFSCINSADVVVASELNLETMLLLLLLSTLAVMASCRRTQARAPSYA